MFTLRKTETGKVIYRCHGCGWECELTAMDQLAAADDALACNETHKCVVEMRPSPDSRAPQGELSQTTRSSI